MARYGADYYPPETRRFKAKANAQDAHEAIRPSNVELTPELVRKSLTQEQYRLYKLIWSRFLSCQMANAVYDSLSIDINAGPHLFRATPPSRNSPALPPSTRPAKTRRTASATPLPDLTEGEAPLPQRRPKAPSTSLSPPPATARQL